MTLEELQTLRDKILKQMAAPKDLRASDGAGLTNRDMSDLPKSLAAIDREIAQLSSSSGSRSTLSQFSRG